MKIKDAMLSDFTARADKCSKLAKSCTAMSEHFSKMEECAKAVKQSDLSSIAAACASEFSKMADTHLQHGEHCAAMAEDCQKADAAEFTKADSMASGGRFDDLMPIAGVSAVAPGKTTGTNRLVRRDGGNGHAFTVPEIQIPREFQRLVKVDE
jgi:hypothetical protein